MAWQAYIDDSYTPEGTFVLGGYIATAENWAQFAKEWNALLPSGGTVANNGRYHFKMSEMSTTPQRMERAPAFYWIIERHVHSAASCKINIADLKRAAGDRYVSGRPANIKGVYGAAPRFEDDQQVLPLQAADFWAWWVRKWYDQNDDEDAGRQIAA